MANGDDGQANAAGPVRSQSRRVLSRLRAEFRRARPVRRQRPVGALAKGPIILHSAPVELAVLWSAKAASTFAVKWFFFQAHLLDETVAYSDWPHDYREEVFCARPGYNADLRNVGILGPRVVKFARDPFRRAVSAYLSLCDQAERVTHPPHGRLLEAIGTHLGRHIGEGNSMSFREYVDFLGSIDLDTCDLHLRRQIHPAERLGLLPNLTLIKIEQSDAVLPEVEERLGLMVSDVGVLGRSLHHTKRVETADFVGDQPFSRTVGIPVPRAVSFYDTALVEQIQELYAEDCERYGYEFSV